jgi:hypothetical protein
MIRLLATVCILLILAVSSPETRAGDASDARDFALKLIRSGEYYRAYRELQRLRFHYPGFVPESEMNVTAQYLWFMGKRPVSLYDSLLEVPVSRRDFHTGRIFLYDLFLSLGEVEKARGVFIPSALSGVPDPFLRQALDKRIELAVLLSPGKGVRGSDRYLSEEVRELLRLREKELISPVGALFLGVIPGMGYIYAREYLTGFLAFLTVGTFVALSVLGYHTGNEVLGTVTALGGAFFYGGSIVGGYRAARGFNRERDRKNIRAIMEGAGLEEDRGRIFSEYGISGR